MKWKLDITNSYICHELLQSIISIATCMAILVPKVLDTYKDGLSPASTTTELVHPLPLSIARNEIMICHQEGREGGREWIAFR